ncbi:hypothetical protein BC939DRAFT_23412 [Gamsiella multidivaricata]|uniref:uncharacterized protein n=1 Tax=Gamsiella multidivaricata TaxID=101098 RepID=UPI0022200361|nr:uncharacterized protein BC939DRAFT_23412 [Gamsiella multidivaricata]KAI7829331.1 hypothetical protein BC939DRAFT_23412 [Gamsiella multidivaricata]
MAASEDGSKVVLFGGTEDGNMYFNTIYILDVSSGKWKQGQEAPVARTRMACAVHSYQFIAWGGSSGGNRNTMLNNLPIVYNLNDDKWTDNYNADEKLRHNNTGAIIGGLFAVLVIAGGVGVFVMKKRQRQKHEEEAAYQADAMAAAAISEDHDSNIKVLAQSPQMTYGNASGYEGYGNEYQMNKMDMNGHYQNGSYDGVGPVHGYHDGMSGAGIVGDPNLQYYHSPSMSAGGMEKSPGAYSHLSPAMLYTGVPNTPQMQSPAVLYAGVSHTPQIQSPAVVYLHQQPEGNPFMSPEDYHRPPPHLSAPSVSSSVTLSPSPFMTATMAMSAKATEYQAPSQSNPFQTPVQQYQSPVWTTATYQAYPSPSPGARAPQAIPETKNEFISLHCLK